MTLETILFDIAVLLVSAKILGEIFERFGFSSLVGEVIAGIIVGSSLLGLVQPSETMNILANIGILFLMFIIGLHAKFEEALENNVYSAALIAVLGGTLSFVLSFIAGIGLGYSFMVAITVGAALTSTGIGITLRALSEMGQFYGRVSKALIATDVADDIFSIIVMSLFLGFMQYGKINILDSWEIFLIVIGFFIIIVKFGGLIAEKVMSMTVKMKDQESMIAIPVVLMFLIALLSQQVNIAGVTGAFLAGIILAKTPYAETTIIPKAKTLGYGFLIPLFFAYTGSNVNIFAVGNTGWVLLIALLIAAIAGKYIGCYAGAKISGFEKSEAKRIAWGMIPRTEYTLVIGQIALVAGAITAGIQSVLVLFVLISTIITPIILKWAYETA
jgi:Kef-type K+ transport system membrane component KefB